MKNLENFKIAADNQDLTIIQINTDGNDYPRGLGSYGAIGFVSIEQAKVFSEENGGDVAHFETRGGHTFWRNKGNAYKPYTASNYVDDCNDNVYETDLQTELDRFKEGIETGIDNEDFELIDKAYQLFKKFQEAYENKGESETIIYDGNSDRFEAIPNEMMSYSEDVYTYAIGVYFNPREHEEEDSESETEE